MTKDEWIEAIGAVPDGDADEGVPAVDWDRADDPDLYDAAIDYLDARGRLEQTADALSGFLMRRGWEAR